ncbi:hypothetical protein GGS20DRAFT_514795 [Poronia punctata]|nr:hypothetical protein GGS20DRAFT_514795 [Poronia punctata]
MNLEFQIPPIYSYVYELFGIYQAASFLSGLSVYLSHCGFSFLFTTLTHDKNGGFFPPFSFPWARDQPTYMIVNLFAGLLFFSQIPACVTVYVFLRVYQITFFFLRKHQMTTPRTTGDRQFFHPSPTPRSVNILPGKKKVASFKQMEPYPVRTIFDRRRWTLAFNSSHTGRFRYIVLQLRPHSG